MLSNFLSCIVQRENSFGNPIAQKGAKMTNTQLPTGFRLAAAGEGGIQKMWLEANQFRIDAWSFAHHMQEHLPRDAKVAFLHRGAYWIASVWGNAVNRTDGYIVRVRSYEDTQQQDNVLIDDHLPEELKTGDGEGWYFVDDLSDSGKTAQAIRTRWPKAKIITLYSKPAGEKHVDYFHIRIPNIWAVFPWEADPEGFVPA